VDLTGLEFLMVSDTHMTETAKKADVVIPGTSFDSTDGTFTNTERRLQQVTQAICEDVVYSNWEIAAELAHVFEEEMPFDDTYDISIEMDDQLYKYKYAEIGEILGGVLKPEKPVFKVVGDVTFVVPMLPTDNLMKVISQRLPKPV
jgi:formate dehydrogenase major subunit